MALEYVCHGQIWSISKMNTNLGMKPAVNCNRSGSKSANVVTNCVHFAVLVRAKGDPKHELKRTTGAQIHHVVVDRLLKIGFQCQALKAVWQSRLVQASF